MTPDTRSLAPLALLLALTGCSSHEDLRTGGPEESYQSVRPLLEPTLEVDMENKAYGTAEVIEVLGFEFGEDRFAEGITYSTDDSVLFEGLAGRAKRAAALDACEEVQADLLVDPRYTVETFSFLPFYRSAKATVRGYPAKITEYRDVRADLRTLLADKSEDATLRVRALEALAPSPAPLQRDDEED